MERGTAVWGVSQMAWKGARAVRTASYILVVRHAAWLRTEERNGEVRRVHYVLGERMHTP